MTFDEALRDYDGICGALASRYFWPGADREDVLQEARIALWHAWQRWDPDGGRAFSSFAWLCVKRRLMDLAFPNHGHRSPALSWAPLEEWCGEDMHEFDYAPRSPDTADVVETRETLREILKTPGLSDLERHALGRAFRGESNGERESLSLGFGRKALGNALQRAKMKAAA